MPERPRPGEPHRSAGTVVRLHCWAQLAILPREFINNAVYIVFDGMSYYGLFGCDIREAQVEDPDIEIISGPYRQWPDEKIEQLNNEL